MIKKSIFLALLVLALPLTALADGGVASFVSIVTALPEPSTLGLLGTGLISFAVVVRRKWSGANGPAQMVRHKMNVVVRRN